MPEILQTDLLTPEQAAKQATPATSSNGLRYATLGRLDSPHTSPAEIARLVGAVPTGIAAALTGFTYGFVPLTLSGARLDGEEVGPFSPADRTLIAPVYQPSLVDKAICHRNAPVGSTEYVFLSSRLHTDRFALAFEFFINIAHNFTDTVGVPATFADLVWQQATANVRGETSIDAWEERADALGQPHTEGESRHRPGLVPRSGEIAPRRAGSIDEKARNAYHAAAFADALAIYLLSLYLDFDYADLREREYPLLTAPALAERLRTVNRIFPPNEGYKFQILYRRRSGN
jgi:hypothetical protein